MKVVGVSKVGRPSIGDRPMTEAERQSRSRANRIGQVDGHLVVAGRIASEWAQCMRDGRSSVTDRDIQAAFEEIAVHIAGCRLELPRS